MYFIRKRASWNVELPTSIIDQIQLFLLFTFIIFIKINQLIKTIIIWTIWGWQPWSLISACIFSSFNSNKIPLRVSTFPLLNKFIWSYYTFLILLHDSCRVFLRITGISDYTPPILLPIQPQHSNCVHSILKFTLLTVAYGKKRGNISYI